MVRVGQTISVVVESLERFIVENVVYAYGLLGTATESVHPSVSTLLETIDKIAEHGVVDIGVGNIVEVAADDGWRIGISDFLGYYLCLR